MSGSADGPAAAFDDSRRLPGPNRWFGVPAVVLQPLGAAAQDDAALAGWAARVQRLCAALRWPQPLPCVQRGAAGTALVFVAPDNRLFTATEVNEWAWERAAASHAALAAQGFTATQPKHDDIDALTAYFTARAAAEISPPLARLKAAALARGLPVFEDDDSVSIGAGSGSRCWPRAALPLPMDVPWTGLHDQPTLLVTGSNGKTTTTRLLAAMATHAGLVAGSCSTEGVVIGGRSVQQGDYAGPAGARAVLRDTAVQFALLETARGGLLRRGLAVRRGDAAVVTNVSADHLGEYGVASVEDIAEVKLVVAHALRDSGTLVLNGSDAVLMAVAARTPHVQALFNAGRVVLFAHDLAHPALAAHQAAGGAVCGVQDGELCWAQGDVALAFGEVQQMPLTLQGAARHNVENIAAAVAAALAGLLPMPAIRQTRAEFGANPLHNPGRLERWAWRGATVLVDYAHNPDGLAQLLQVAQALMPAHPPARPPAPPPSRLGLLLGQAGNRDDAAITELASTAARFAPARVVLKELPGMLRGRALGEVPGLLKRGLLAGGMAAHHIHQEDDETAAALALLAWAQPGDVVVLPVHTAAVRLALAALLAGGALSA